FHVTGVQTCALPISRRDRAPRPPRLRRTADAQRVPQAQRDPRRRAAPRPGARRAQPGGLRRPPGPEPGRDRRAVGARRHLTVNDDIPREASMGYRLGVDVGGTFTDVLLVDEETGVSHRAKTASTPADQS